MPLSIFAPKMDKGISDYCYLVFPFSKAYEGFLKKLFLDLKLMRPEDYYSDDIRIGKILNPHFVKEHGAVYHKLHIEVAEKLWTTWKSGRNLVFHYFPHNFRRLSYTEAKELIEQIVDAMTFAVSRCQIAL